MCEVSVIVPVYSVEDYLERCLDSLVSQSFRSYEVICINDASPDNSKEILEAYQQKYPSLLRVFHNKENLGLGLTRNVGLSQARGKYILFVDSDDYVKQDYIESYYMEMENSPADIIVGGYIRKTHKREKTHMMSQTVWSTVTYAIACAKMFKASFLKNNNLKFTDLKCGEDILFSLEAFYCNASFRVINYAGYYYVYNQDSITGLMDYKKNHEQIMANLFTYFLSTHDISLLSRQKREIIEYVYIANMINTLVVFNHGCGIKIMKQKYEFVIKDIKEKFPNYKRNSFMGIVKPKGQTLKIRLGVGGFVLLSKVHFDRLFFYLCSIF